MKKDEILHANGVDRGGGVPSPELWISTNKKNQIKLIERTDPGRSERAGPSRAELGCGHQGEAVKKRDKRDALKFFSFYELKS